MGGAGYGLVASEAFTVVAAVVALTDTLVVPAGSIHGVGYGMST